MKIIKITIVILSTISCFAFYDKLSFGVGTFTSDVGQIEKEVGGSTNTFEFNVFLKSQLEFDIFWDQRLIFDFGFSFPRSSRDTHVQKINYWTNLLHFSDFGIFRLHYGLGFFFTRLSMDGQTQVLNNGGVDQEFQTPSGSSFAVNNVLVTGASINVDSEMYIELQANVMNVEDSLERAFNYFLSINYSLSGSK